MTATITKRADELKRGDVITNLYGAHMMPCPAVVINDYKCGSVRLSDAAGGLGTIMIGYAQGVEVEAPALSPAQQHAEELLKSARHLVTTIDRHRPHVVTEVTIAVESIRELLAKIDPPAPPTLEEAIELLRDMQGNGAFDAEYGSVGRPQAEKARSILARAYRAGVPAK